jgi:RNA polymerase sigma-70 factor (ECF subfamily)
VDVESAITALYDEHARKLYAYARALVRDPAMAEDVVHEVFLKLVRVLSRGHPQLIELPYLVAAVRNESYSALRRQRGRHHPVELDTRVQPTTTDEHERRMLLTELCAQLPVEQRDVVVLKALYGYTFAEIAALTKMKADTVASRYRYGMSAIRRALQLGRGRHG